MRRSSAFAGSSHTGGLKFKPKDGVQVLVRGRVDIYEQRSEYQFVVETIEPQGHGALQLAFDQLKQNFSPTDFF